MVSFAVNGVPQTKQKNLTIFQALKGLGVDFARFCYHESLPVAGNCRACLIELSHFEKPVVACTADLEINQNIWPESLFAQKCKENIFESLLANHPLDCPICDQAGECDLQDQAKVFGGDRSRFFLNKRGVFDKNCDFLVKAIMTRCIHCTRCVRFNTSLQASKLGMLLRGTASSVGNYLFKKIDSNLFGNVVDLCPVGALTTRVQAFSARPWEIKFISGVDLLDGLGSTIYYQVQNNTITKIIPKPNKLINGNIINDNCRFLMKTLPQSLISLQLVNKKTFTRKLISWFFFFKLIDSLIYQNKNKIWLLLTEISNVGTIDFTKTVSNKLKKKIKILLPQKYILRNNFYGHQQNLVALNKISVCFFLSTNLKLESAILNFKIATTYKKTLLSLFSLGRVSQNNFNPFCGLHLKSTINLFEAKSKFLCRYLYPVFLCGRSFFQRGDLFAINVLLKQKFKTSSLWAATIFCNEKGGSFLNLPRTSIKKTTSLVFCLNTKDSFWLRKLSSLLSTKIFWFNHVSVFNFNIFSAIPVTSSLNETGVYLSQKLSITKKVLISPIKARSITTVLSSVFQIQINLNKSLTMLLTELTADKLNSNVLIVKNQKIKTKLLLLEMKTGWEV